MTKRGLPVAAPDAHVRLWLGTERCRLATPMAIVTHRPPSPSRRPDEPRLYAADGLRQFHRQLLMVVSPSIASTFTTRVSTTALGPPAISSNPPGDIRRRPTGSRHQIDEPEQADHRLRCRIRRSFRRQSTRVCSMHLRGYRPVGITSTPTSGGPSRDFDTNITRSS